MSPGARLVGLVLAVAAAVALFGASDAGAQQTTVQVTSATAEAGQERTVQLQVLDVGPPGLGAWTVDVQYDPALVSIVGCSAEHGGICNPAYTGTVARVTGTAIFGLEGDVALAGVTFGCAAVGTSSLSLSLSVLADATLGTPQDIAAGVVNGSITCLEPGTAQQLVGDVNCDERVNSIDAQLVLQYVAELISQLLCIENADVDGDGDITPIDATLILQMDAGLI